jgi:hypothetical protein
MGFIPAVPDPAKDLGNYFHAKAGMLPGMANQRSQAIR